MSKSDVTNWQFVNHGASRKLKMKIKFLHCGRNFLVLSTDVPSMRNEKGTKTDNCQSKFLVEVHDILFQGPLFTISLRSVE